MTLRQTTGPVWALRQVPIGFMTGMLLASTLAGDRALAGDSYTAKGDCWRNGTSSAAAFDALVAAGDARQQQYLREFIASGTDPRTLPREFVSGSSGEPDTLRGVIAISEVIVRAQVIRTEFVGQPLDLPLTISTVRVSDVARGSAVGAELKVVQRGGPVPQSNRQGGALAQLETDEILLTGDDVVLFLRAERRVGGYMTVGAAGIYFIRDGVLVPEKHNKFARTVPRTWSDLAALVRFNR